MTLRFKSALLIVAALALTTLAQLKPFIKSEDRPVLNEDGGQAFIIETNRGPLVPSGSDRKGTISQPEQYSIFIGSDWTSPLQQREAQLQSLLANVSNEAELTALQQSGIKNRFGPTASEERPDISARSFSDMDLQRLLAAMLDDGTLARPTNRTIYVVFLDSGFESKLGSLVARKHYVAYHSIFRAAGADVRYVVVPFESDPTAASQIALRAFVAAAVRPARLAK
ncbi:MAG TPA: hypothetical protein VGJ69_03610 [Pyrinomonadaceae bacterium]|jgi:hypothetical protein